MRLPVGIVLLLPLPATSMKNNPDRESQRWSVVSYHKIVGNKKTLSAGSGKKGFFHNQLFRKIFIYLRVRILVFGTSGRIFVF